ncbi:MAG: hypothetical protein LBK25_03575 [Treponema sp.]|nr:hypothetical protein [Treponema sp.]
MAEAPLRGEPKTGGAPQGRLFAVLRLGKDAPPPPYDACLAAAHTSCVLKRQVGVSAYRCQTPLASERDSAPF